jgi:hypothetical protein
MCLLCVKYKKGEMTSKEVFKKIQEDILMASNPKDKQILDYHLFSISEMILSKESPSVDRDQELEERWHKEMYGEDHEE